MECLQASEYNSVVESVQLSYFTSVVDELVEHLVERGFDAWWRLSHNGVRIACDLHIIILRGRYGLKPITDANIDSFRQGGAWTQPNTIEQ